MKRSEIFDNFVKIAQEKGMISNDSSKSKKILEETGRADSLDISAIEALYGVKPDASKGLEYKNNIMEVAHPNGMVIAPSYDKLNGLVENNIEAQNIALHIVNKTNDGHSVQRKYAEKELLLSLVRIANDMDNRNQDQLRSLADVCLVQAHNGQLKKKAFPLIPVLVGAAAVLTAVWANEHLPNLSQGLKKDSSALLAACNKFLTSNTDYGVGHKYDPALKSDVQGLVEKVGSFISTYDSLAEVARQIEKPTDGTELEQEVSSSNTQSALQAHAKLSNLATQMSQYLTKIHDDFTSNVYKDRHTEETGMFTGLLERTHLLGGKDSLFGDDFEDLLKTIPPFQQSVQQVVNFYEQEVPAHKQKVTDELHQDYIAQQSATVEKEPAAENTGEDEEGLSSLEKELGEHAPGLFD
jgi:hypothetical protein